MSAHLEEVPDADDVVGGPPEHDIGTSAGDDIAPTGDGPADGDAPDDAAPPRSAAARKGRPSVPSWDDIVFGTRGGGSG